MVQLGGCITCGDIDTGDRFRCDDQPTHRSWRLRHRVQNALLEQFGVGEEQRRIPPKQDQTRYPAGIRISRDVMIAFDTLGAAQHGGVWTPAVPQELNDGDRDGQTYSWNGAEHGHADETDDRYPEL